MDRVKQGVRCTQYMIWGWSVVNMIAMFFFGKYMTYLFISTSETEVIKVAVPISILYSGFIRSSEVFSFTEIPYREWATD